jgi:hypothetical protein
VKSMKEVWGVLEVVREQAWLSEMLLSLEWTPEGLNDISSQEKEEEEETDATEDELNAVLDGKNPLLCYMC